MSRLLDKLTRTNKVPGVACLTTIVFVLAPSLTWILSDRSVWGWDPAHYGYWTLRIWHARSGGLWSWLDAMLHSVGSMPPLLAWLGQFFVPLQHVTGDLESALLQMNLMMAAGTLTLVYVIVRRLGGDTLSSLTAVLACGGSAIFIGLTHRYMVEITQAFAVTAVAFVALRAERRSSVRTFGLLATVVTVSLLSKATSVTFVLPLLGYVALALSTARRRPRPATRPVDVALAVTAIVIVAATLSWYVINWAPMAAHFARSVSGENALRYGSPVHLPMKLTYWSYSLGQALSAFGVVWAGILTVVAVAFGAEARRLVRLGAGRVERALNDGTLFAAAVAGTVVLTLVTYALQVNEAVRFLTPVVPLCALLVGWSLSVLGRPFVTSAFVVALSVSALTHHAYAYALFERGAGAAQSLRPIQRDARARDLLARAVLSTCHPDGRDRWNVIGVNYMWMNANSANFYAQKTSAGTGSRCRYTNLGGTESELRFALDRIAAIDPLYIVTIAVGHQPPPDSINQFSRPLAEHLAGDTRFRLAPGSDDTLLIYRNGR